MESIQDVVKKYQQGGNNCSETVLKACNEYYGLNLSDDVFRMVSVMGGGVGGSGCLCGARLPYPGPSRRPQYAGRKDQGGNLRSRKGILSAVDG